MDDQELVEWDKSVDQRPIDLPRDVNSVLIDLIDNFLEVLPRHDSRRVALFCRVLQENDEARGQAPLILLRWEIVRRLGLFALLARLSRGPRLLGPFRVLLSEGLLGLLVENLHVIVNLRVLLDAGDIHARRILRRLSSGAWRDDQIWRPFQLGLVDLGGHCSLLSFEHLFQECVHVAHEPFFIVLLRFYVFDELAQFTQVALQLACWVVVRVLVVF